MINILLIAILFFFSVTIFVVFLHFYAKWFWFPDPRRTTNVIYARRSFVFGSNDVETAAGERRKGLDPEVINSLKTLVYKSDDPSMSSKEGIDCAVCLSEVTDGETIRLLPKCNHGFHVECIDMWFLSHSSCPLCRNAVVDEKPVIDNDSGSTELVSGNGYSTELPPNVLFWGNHDQGGVSASGGGVVAARTESREGVLVLDIPRRVLTEDDLKSPATGTPMSARFGSLKRFLSREKKAATSPSSSSSSSSHHPPTFSGDVEQGIRQADVNE